ncbi:MAG: hypothetical protein WBF35_04870 [Candidatus Acidiferrales bacterium]
MDQIIKALHTTALKIAIPALVLGAGLLISSPLLHAAHDPCGAGTGYSCTDSGKKDPDPVPEPSILLELGAGLTALAIVGRRLVPRKS